MDPWRIGLAVAAVCFIAFLLVKMRPRGPAGAYAPRETRAERRERRLLRRVLYLAGQLSPESRAKLREDLDEQRPEKSG